MRRGESASAAPRAFRSLIAGGDTSRLHRAVANITFHRVADADASNDERYDVTASALAILLDAVVAHQREPNGVCGVNITIDDGNASDLTCIAPALLSRGLSGTFFVCAGRIGGSRFLDAGGIRELLTMGMRVGSHGMNHVGWRGLDARKLMVEIAGAKARLEDLIGRAVVQAACPFGQYDRRSLRALGEAGFERVYTSDRALASTETWLQPRWTIGGRDTPGTVTRLLRTTRASWTRRVVIAAKQWR